MQHLPVFQAQPFPSPQLVTLPKPAMKQPRKKPFVVTSSHDSVLQGIHKLHIATCKQLLALLGYSENSLERVQKLVKQLADNGFLDYDCVPTKKGKSPYYYFLAKRGRQYCEALGQDIREYFRPSEEKALSSPFLHHTMSLNDILISAIRLEHHAPEFSLSSFIHERVLKQTPYKASMLRSDGTEERCTLIPDALLDFRHTKDNGKEKKILVLYEHDMGTTEQFRFRRKLRGYITFIKAGAYKELFNAPALIIAYGTPLSQKRCEQMMDWTRKEMASTKEPKWLTRFFLFASMPVTLHPLEVWIQPRWFLPFDDITPRSMLA